MGCLLVGVVRVDLMPGAQSLLHRDRAEIVSNALHKQGHQGSRRKAVDGPLAPNRIEKIVQPSLEWPHEVLDDVIQSPGRTATFDVGKRDYVAVSRRPQTEPLHQVPQTHFGVSLLVESNFNEGRGLGHPPIDRTDPQILLSSETYIQEIVADAQPLREVAQGRCLVSALCKCGERKAQKLVLIQRQVGILGRTAAGALRSIEHLKGHIQKSLTYKLSRVNLIKRESG